MQRSRSSLHSLISGWGWLTQPIGSITDAEQRRKARFTLRLQLVLITLGGFVTAHYSLVVGTKPSMNLLTLFALLGVLIAYGMVKFGYVAWGQWLTLLISIAAVLISISPIVGEDIGLSSYLILPAFLAGILFSHIQMRRFTALNLLIITPYMALMPNLPTAGRVGWWGFLAVTFVMLQVFIEYYHHSEKQRYMGLLQQEALLKLLTENARDIVFLLDAEGVFAYVNNAYEELTGFKAEEVLHKHATEVTYQVHPDDLPAATNQLDALLIERKKVSQVFRTLHRDGYYVSLESVADPILDEAGLIKGYLVTLRDITSRQEAQRREVDLAIEREKVNLLQNFISNLSHDLRTPLAVINTSLFILSRTTEPDRIQQRIVMMQAQVEHLTRMVEKMLVMGSLDNDFQMEFVRCQINPILERVGQTLQTLAESRGVELTLHLQPNPPLIDGDVEQLSRVFSNLIENALHFTPAGGTVKVFSQVEAQILCVCVIDTGVGIEEGDLPYIFDRFYRADKSRSGATGGTGLGLAIVKKIVELHGGSVEVKSQPGKGATFSVMLPHVGVTPQAKPADVILLP